MHLTQARFHETVGHADDSWVDKEKGNDLLNFREFNELLLRIARTYDLL
jgi:hypothetical protein